MEVEPVDVWFCTGPRCAAVGGLDLLAEARKQLVGDGARICTRNCFSRCELEPAPLPSVRIGREWQFPIDRQTVLADIRQLSEGN